MSSNIRNKIFNLSEIELKSLRTIPIYSPTLLTANSSSYDEISLYWNNTNSSDFTNIRIYKSLDDINYGYILRKSNIIPPVTISNLESSTRYYFKTKYDQIDSGRYVLSEYSNMAYISTLPLVGSLIAPNNLVVYPTLTSPSFEIGLEWQNNDVYENIRIQYSADNSTWGDGFLISGNSSTWIFPGLRNTYPDAPAVRLIGCTNSDVIDCSLFGAKIIE